MADELGDSASYLNHLERNQRPVTAGMLLRLAEVYDVDVKRLRLGGRRRGRRRPARRDLLRPDARATSASAATSWSSWPTMRRRSPKASPGSTPRCSEAAPRPEPGERRATPRALITPETWVRDYIQAQRNHYPELEEAPRRLAARSAIRCRCRSRCAGGSRKPGASTARVVPQTELGNASQHYDADRARSSCCRRCCGAENRHVRARLPARAARVRAGASSAWSPKRAPPDDGIAAAAPHELRQLRGRRDHDAVRPVPRAPREEHRYAIDRLCGAVRRQRRAGRPPPHDARPARRARRALLHAAGRSGGEHLEALCRRELPLLALRRDLPALESARRLPDAGPDHPPADRDARRPALFHHQPDDRAADPARSARRRPAGDRPRLRHPARRTNCLRRRLRSRQHAGDAGRSRLRDLPAAAMRVIAPPPPAGRMLAVDENRKTISPYPFVAA